MPGKSSPQARGGLVQQSKAIAKSTTARPLLIQVKVKPNARFSSLEHGPGDTWTAQLKAAPVDGKANAELTALVASRFGCRKSAVSIKRGASSRMKLVQIDLA